MPGDLETVRWTDGPTSNKRPAAPLAVASDLDNHDVVGSNHDGCRLAAVVEFLNEHGAALVNASDLIGGPSASGRALELMADVGRASKVSPGMRRDLAALHRLLSFTEADVQDRKAGGRFAGFRSGSSVIEEIGLLADRLLALLDALDGFEQSTPEALRSAAV